MGCRNISIRSWMAALSEQDTDMAGGSNPIEAPLAEVVKTHIKGATGISGLKRLSGGASQETWSFDATTAGEPVPLILRRAPGGARPPSETAVGLATEAKLIELAAAADVPVPTVHYVLAKEDGVGDGFIMNRVAGETIARKILRDAEFANARPILARQCGEIFAKLHRIDRATLPPLCISPAKSEIAQYRNIYKAHGHPHPVFELALRWLADNTPPPSTAHTLVHGDFRNGNLMIGPDGVRA